VRLAIEYDASRWTLRLGCQPRAFHRDDGLVSDQRAVVAVWLESIAQWIGSLIVTVVPTPSLDSSSQLPPIESSVSVTIECPESETRDL
jgi:hypothetical protein